MNSSKMSYEAWCVHVEQCASTMVRGLVNFRNVEFAWADRYQDDEPLAGVIDALVAAGMNQVVQAVGEATSEALEVVTKASQEDDEPEERYFDDENIYGLPSIAQSIAEDRRR